MSREQMPPSNQPFRSSLDEFALLAARPSRHPQDAAPAPALAASPLPATPSPPLAPGLLALRGNELEYFPTQWVWPGRIACAKLTLIGGAPGTGKSTLIMRMAAAVTTGDAWPCLPHLCRIPLQTHASMT
jgi:AAA domain